MRRRQKWFPEDNAADTSEVADYIMYRSPDGNPLSYDKNDIVIPDGDCVVWRSDEQAQEDVSFGVGTWQGKITLGAKGYDLSNIEVELGYLNGGAFTKEGEALLSDWKKGQDKVIHYYITPTTSFTVPRDGYLALRICNNSSSDVAVGTGDTQQWLKAPKQSPVYPLPEVPALALFAIGLFCLGGYMVLRRGREECL